MFLNFFRDIGIVTSIVLCVILVILFICLIKALILCNKDIKILPKNDVDKNVRFSYGKKLEELVRIATTSNETAEQYHEFREKLKKEYPLIHQNFDKERIDGNAVFTYKRKIEGAPNILYATHIDSKIILEEPYMTQKHLYGSGTYDAKALLFVILEAIENVLREDKVLNNNLTIVMTKDDEDSREGEDKIIDKFLREGKFFDLIIEEGSGIMNPISSGLRSHYAFIGIGVTGEVTFRFKTSKAAKGEARLQNFIFEISSSQVFKAKIDKQTRMTIKAIARDMTFSNRIIYSNSLVFRGLIKRFLDNDQVELSRVLKTQARVGEVLENDTDYYVDVVFELANHDNVAEVLCAIDKYMLKYSVEYEMIASKEGTRITSTKTKAYKTVTKVIKDNFDDIYIAPWIITSISENREYDRVSDNVIRFSPLYYSHNAKINRKTNNEYVSLNSLAKGVSFFEKLTREYSKR